VYGICMAVFYIVFFCHLGHPWPLSLASDEKTEALLVVS
jgi:hypothetical protein